jgi:glutamyl-tRNA synthetase
MGFAMPDEREEFSLEEFVDAFDLTKISLGGPVFDLEKLTWLNGKHIRALEPPDLLRRLRSGQLSDEYLLEVLPLAHERIETLADFIAYAGFFFTGDVDYDENARGKMVAKGMTPAQTAKLLRVLLEESLDPIMDWTVASVEEAMRSHCERHGLEAKQLFMPVRVAVTGRTATPGLFDTMAVLGKEICRRRLRCAIELLRSLKA